MICAKIKQMKSIVTLLSFLILLLAPCSQAFAQQAEIYLTVNRHNIFVGDAISGQATVKLYEGYGGTASQCHVSIAFESGAGGGLNLGFDCEYDPVASSKNYTVCEKKFTHVYDTAGEKQLTVSASHGGLIAQKRTTIVVSHRSSPTVTSTFGPAIEATTTAKIVERVIKIVYGLFTVLLVLIIMIGGFVYLTSAGKPEQITRGKKILIYGIVGFAIMVLSRGIIEFIFLVLGIDNQITLF